MSLENLKYGNFKPTTVAPEARTLPGFGGQVEEWANYKFQISALEKKENQLSEGERKKLGPLGLRLVERLQGPALQVAKTLGVDALAETTGVATLLTALEKELLPLRRQLALEMYSAGSSHGMLSRQHAEPMASYVLRRETWWSQLCELDPEVQCSKAILGEQMLQQAGLTNMETQLVRTVLANDLSDTKRLTQTLRDQYGQVHERERNKGRHKGQGKGSWNWNRNYGYLAESDITTQEPSEITANLVDDEENFDYTEEEHYEEGDEWLDNDGEVKLEEEIVAWYSEQGIHTQTCSAEDLELIYDTVETEAAAYFTRQQAAQRGHSVPAGHNPYQTNAPVSDQEKQARVLAAKQRSRCRACGQQGHWQRDWICPKRKGGFKGKSKGFKGKKGGFKSKGDGKSGGSSNGSSPTGKPRIVYFSLRDEDEGDGSGFAGMVLRGEPTGPEPLDDEQQRMMENEVRRLLRLPQEEIDRRFQQEVEYMTPTSKAAGMSPPRPEVLSPHLVAVPKTPPRLPTPSMSSAAMASGDSGCQHQNTTKRGSNGYVDMLSCKDCGLVLRKEPKETTRQDQGMRTQVPTECSHQDVSWKGTNGHVWMWTCQDCGKSEKIPKSATRSRPVPGLEPEARRNDRDAGSTSSSWMARTAPETGEALFHGEDQWRQYRDLLDRMVTSHLTLHHEITATEFHHLVNATTTCFRSFSEGVRENLIPSRSRTLADEASLRTSTSSVGTSATRDDGQRKLTFGRYKGQTFQRVYQEHPDYVRWTMDEVTAEGGYSAGMKKWHAYCQERLDEEAQHGQTYMALKPNEDEEDDDEATYMFLDSGCNQTCHGELWMRRFIRATGYTPEWISQDCRSLSGIGGATETQGERQLYISFEEVAGNQVPGELLVSTEIKGSRAPLLLSLVSQEKLGLVVDFAASVIYSKKLDMTFKAVRGKRNRLLGMKLTPAEFVDVIPMEPLALMAEDEDEDGSWEDRSRGDKRAAGDLADYESQQEGRLRFTGDTRGRPRQTWAAGCSSSAAASSGLTDSDRYAGGDGLRSSSAPTSSEVRELPQPEGPRLHLPEGHPAREGPREPDLPPPGYYVEPEEIEEIDLEEFEPGEFDPVDPEPTPTSAHEVRQGESYESREEEDPVVEDEAVSPEASPDRQPEGEDDLDAAPVGNTPTEDWWDQTEHCIIRHHFDERNTLFYPSGSRMDLPVDLDRLLDSRVTVKHYTTGDVEVVRDNWREGYRQVFTRTSHGVNRFQAGPTGSRLVRRITTNLDTGGCIADEDERALNRVHQYTRLLPDGVRNVRSEFYLVDDVEDEKEWTGTTTFKLRPLTEELREEPCSLEPEVDRKRSMTKGQRKQLEKKIEVLEDSDMAMWSAIHRQPVYLPRFWKIVLELFCGCALLTRMFQARGYDTCEPLDIHNGWDVFNPDHRRRAEAMIDQQNPYLLALGFPCGPWSPFQHLNPDQEKVQFMRRKWTPILAWIRHLVEKQHRKGGRSLLENPWTSQAWNTKELAMLREENGGLTDMRAVRIDQCALGLRDVDNGMLHKKATAIVADSQGVRQQFQGKLCNGKHQHQPLEGSNRGGSRTKQAARWTPTFCRCIIRGIQNDLQEETNVAFAAEMREEEIEEDPHPLDAVYGEEDLPSAKETVEEQERSIAREEQLEQLEREADPQSEKVRRAGWLKLGRSERIGIRRLHAMTSHATRPQMQRMLRFSNAPAAAVSAVKFFRCSSCEKLNEEKRVQVTKVPSAYVFGELVGTDVLEIKDAKEERYHVLHTVCEGTTYQAGDILGVATGVPSSKSCLEAFLRYWCSWAGFPKVMKVDRGTHNRGIFQGELEKLGVEVRSIATEAPYQIGRTERAGGTSKGS